MAAQFRSESDNLASFLDAMAAAGLRTHDKIIPDGELRRFHVEGDAPRTRNGWYVLYMDGIPAGEFGCWKRGQQSTWCGNDRATLTTEQNREVIERIERARELRKQAEKQRHAEAARLANAAWDAATEVTGTDHPYLQRKGVISHGLRRGLWQKADEAGETWLSVPDALLVPIRDNRGSIVNLQAIFAAKHPKLGRDKDFMAGGKKRGCYIRIGSPKAGEPIVICEGYATGASIHAATGWCVVVAFDAGNLVPVAEYIRGEAPQATIIIAADNDRWTSEPMENPGVHYAKRAGQAASARVVVPEFKDLTTRPTDFNDLQALEGADEVKHQLAAGVPAVIAANDNTPPAVPVDVDFYTPLADVNGKGKPLSTIENLGEVCNRLGITVRYNVISKEEEILVPRHSFSMDNQANASLAWLMSWCARFNMPIRNVTDFVTYLADQNLYNPVVQWITSKTWDGRSRLPQLYATITAKGEASEPKTKWLKETLMKRWLVSAAAAAFKHDGVSAHGVLVLQGDQYLGKTKWFKSLVPPELGVLKDGMILRPDDKDSVKQVCSFWLVELGEIDATFRKSDIAQLKSFITNQSDVLRRVFARKESHFARRTVFFGSVNPETFLHDTTGNRRFWTISCDAIDHSHNIDMQQLWAEAYQLYAEGEPHYLSIDEMAALNEHNESFTVSDPVEERIATRLNWDAPATNWQWKTATDVLLSIGMDRPTLSDTTKAAQHLRKLNGGVSRKSNGKKLLFVPPLNYLIG